MYRIEKTGRKKSVWSRKKTKIIGEKTKMFIADPDIATEHNQAGSDGLDKDESKMIKRITDQIQDEQFDRNDPFYALKCQNESFRKRLVKLQLLLGRENCLKNTPLQTAIESPNKHLVAGVRLVFFFKDYLPIVQ